MKLKPNSNIEHFKSFVRTKYAWPGGYPLYMLCVDGGCICHKCAEENAALIIRSTVRRDDQQWMCWSIDVNWEDPDKNMFCDHCGELIECVYPSEEESEC